MVAFGVLNGVMVGIRVGRRVGTVVGARVSVGVDRAGVGGKVGPPHEVRRKMQVVMLIEMENFIMISLPSDGLNNIRTHPAQHLLIIAPFLKKRTCFACSTATIRTNGPGDWIRSAASHRQGRRRVQ
jgi:hypothetical protein